MSYKTTKKDFAEFKKEAEYWVEYFGLKNWEIHFDHDDKEGTRAYCNFNKTGGITTITLSIDWNNKPVKNEVKKSAFHEVCEVLLHEMTIMGINMFDEGYVSARVHDVIRRLENTIFKEHRK